jgi:glycosyltransferase involved in cell wall biosynthesis
MQKVLIIGPAHPLRGGGLTTFNQRLAREFIAQGDECSIVSFSLQYPSFLFPGSSQYTTEPAPEGLHIHSLINSINPLNWMVVGQKLKSWKPDLVVVRYWLPFMGPALGTILRLIKRNKHTKIICIADNVIPHEKRPGDKVFSTYFLKAPHAFITMSETVLTDLKTFQPGKPTLLVPHPLYDNFGTSVSKQEARSHLSLPFNDKIILFFGFIRKYKGLDLLIEAMKDQRIQSQKIKLLIAGEFYDDKTPYLDQIKKNGLEQSIILRDGFIADNQVRYYLCAGDCVVQPYRDATQSGVTPLAYHFEKPMIVTNVGGLPALVPHKKVGLVCEPNPSSIADAIISFYAMDNDSFQQNIQQEKQKYSWVNFVQAIKKLYQNLT